MINKIILIHPTKCSGTTISKELLRLKGLSNNYSDFYSGYSFNRFFQKNITFFYSIIHAKNIILMFSIIIFYFICLVSYIRNLFSKHTFGLTFNKGSYQHFTYREWKNINKIKNNSICISVVTHPQHRIASSYYFLGYYKHYNFLDFLKKIKDGSLLSLIKFPGFKAIIKQHLIGMHEYMITENREVKVDVILRRENLNKDWKSFCKSHKIKYVPLKRINKTKYKQEWKKLYHIYPEASRLVYELYENDFKHFGYKVLSG